MTATEPLSLTHPPAPHHGRVPSWRTAFGVIAGPAAWFIQVCVGTALASAPCFPHTLPHLKPAAGLAWTWPALIALLILCTLIAFAGFLVSWQSYQIAVREAGVGHQNHMDEGSGRPRFMALWGVLYGATFGLITLFNFVAYVVLPRCAG